MYRFYLKSELLKFIYNRWLLLSIAGILIFVPTMVLSLDALSGEVGELLYRSKMMQGFYLGQVGYCVLSALYFGQEYLHFTLRTGLLCIPKRKCFLLSKYCCVLICAIMLILTVYLSSVLVLYITSGTKCCMDTLISLIPAFLSTLELTLLTAAIVILTRSQIVSIAILTSLVLGLGNLLLQYSNLMQYLPVLATMNGFLITKSPAYLPAWDGVVVQGVWCVILLLIAAIMFRKRYVR